MTGMQKLACLLLLAMAIAAAICIRPADGAVVTYEPYTVQYGDTLWDIAEAHKPDGTNTRDYMDKLKRHNKGLTAYIHPGDVVEIIRMEDEE